MNHPEQNVVLNFMQRHKDRARCIEREMKHLLKKSEMNFKKTEPETKGARGDGMEGEMN